MRLSRRLYDTDTQCHVLVTPSCFLPSVTKLRRLSFYTCLSVHRGGQYLRRSPLGPDTPPGTRYTPLGPDTPSGPGTHPWNQVHLQDQVHPPDQIQPLGPGTTPGTRYTPRDQIHPSGTRYTPPGPGTPPRDQVHPPGDGYCCGRYASYCNAFLFIFCIGFF